MDIQLTNEIIREIGKFSEVRCAITNDLGEVMAKSANFGIAHPQLDIKGTKALAIKHRQKILGYLYIDESAATRREISRVLKSLVDLIIKQNYHSLILSSDEKRIDQITYDYLFSNNVSEDDFSRILSSFKIDITVKRAALLLEICDPNYLLLFERGIVEGEREKIVARTKRSLESILKVFYTKHKDNIVAYLGGKNFLILKDMGDDPLGYQEEFKKTLNNLHYNFENELRTQVTIGVGEYKEGLQGIKESFTEARTALRFGEQTWGVNKIYHYDNFGVVAPLFSGANRDNISFSKDIIKKISTHEGLLKTLDVYLEKDLSLTETSRELKIHRNTLVYRLARIESLTELDPRLFNDAFQLKIALILGKYHA